MFWEAAQQRLTRARRSRLAEHYRAAYDAAMHVLVSSGQAKPVGGGTWRSPEYIDAQRSAPVRTPAARDRALAQLSVLIPGIVKGVA